MRLCNGDLLPKRSRFEGFFQIFSQSLSVPNEGPEDGDDGFVDQDSSGGKSGEFGLDFGEELPRGEEIGRRMIFFFCVVLIRREWKLGGGVGGGE